MKKDFYDDVIKDSFKRSIKGKIWKWLLGSDGSLVALLLFGEKFLKTEIESSIWIGVWILSILYLSRLILIFMTNLVKYLHYNYKESVYGDAIIMLRDSFAKVHQLRRSGTIDDVDFIRTMSEFCNNLKIVFDKKTGKTCSVSIKVPSQGKIDTHGAVYNLCRDNDAMKQRDNDIYRNTEHTVTGNSAFINIVVGMLNENKAKMFYLNNDINSGKDYENTSKNSYSDGIFPYESELVCPIIPQVWNKKTDNFPCLGFICIDSNTKNSFDDKYDVAIVGGVADGIYDLITLRNSQKS